MSMSTQHPALGRRLRQQRQSLPISGIGSSNPSLPISGIGDGPGPNQGGGGGKGFGGGGKGFDGGKARNSYSDQSSQTPV